MREILFRGKRIDNVEWVEGFYIHKYDPVLDIVYAFIVTQHEKESFVTWHKVDPASVGQYTGLTDKNGKRIFEGDICRNTKTGEIVSVKWHGTMAGFVWSRRKEKSHLYDWGELFRAYDKYEVVGTVHDNPELLEGGGE